MTPQFKILMQFFGYLALIMVTYGVALPVLFSAQSTVAVIFGFIVMAIVTSFLLAKFYLLVKGFFQ